MASATADRNNDEILEGGDKGRLLHLTRRALTKTQLTKLIIAPYEEATISYEERTMTMTTI